MTGAGVEVLLLLALNREGERRGKRGVYLVIKDVVGKVEVTVVYCVSVLVMRLVVAVTVLTEASGALLPNLFALASLADLSTTKLRFSSASSEIARLNFALLIFWAMVLMMVISILAIGSAIQFGVGEAQDGVAETVVCTTEG